MPAIATETKGAVYEAFVRQALQRAFPSDEVAAHPHLPGVLAEQDIAVGRPGGWVVIAGVTFWGSHETAKMKFWRIHEDVFEVHQALPKVPFLHILFESARETSLASLVHAVCGGMALDEETCPSLQTLRGYVATDAGVKSFGPGSAAVAGRCRDLLAADAMFREVIEQLAKCLRAVLTGRHADAGAASLLERACRPAGKGSDPRSFHFSGARATCFKEALLRLLDLGPEELAVCERGSLAALGRIQILRDKGLIRVEGLCDQVFPSAELSLLLDHGTEWCRFQQEQLRRALVDPEQIRDIAEPGLCEDRLERLLAADSARSVLTLLQERSEGRRCWPVDYFLAIEREHTRGRKFGFGKLSAALGVPYRGGISALPRFAGGDASRLSAEQQRALAGIMVRRMKNWRQGRATPEVVRSDRRITLRKKVPALEVLVLDQLRSRLAGVSIQRDWPVDHPLAARCGNRAAGRTSFNFRLTGPRGAALLFIVSSREATHKHKEVSGRLRAAFGSGAIASSTPAYLVVDGLFLADEETAAARCAMLFRAGWDGAFFPDELDLLLKRLADDLGGHLSPLAGTPTSCRPSPGPADAFL